MARDCDVGKDFFTQVRWALADAKEFPTLSLTVLTIILRKPTKEIMGAPTATDPVCFLKATL